MALIRPAISDRITADSFASREPIAVTSSCPFPVRTRTASTGIAGGPAGAPFWAGASAGLAAVPFPSPHPEEIKKSNKSAPTFLNDTFNCIGHFIAN